MKYYAALILFASFNTSAFHEPSTPPARGQHPRSSYQARRISDATYMVDILKEQALAEVSTGKRCRIIKICISTVLVVLILGGIVTIVILKYRM